MNQSEENKNFIIRARGIIMHEDKLLVVKHRKDSGFYALPGGHLEWGENIKECITREIMEELGVKPKIGRLFYINNFIEENTQSIEFLFEILNGVDYLDLEKHNRTHAHELFEIRWASKNDNIKILPEKLAEDFNNGELVSDKVRYIN
jgi:8-oxo-dGTP diphosphatase